jgi:hypothetical protein
MHRVSVQALRPIGGVEVLLYPFMTTALEGVRGQRHAPAALYPRKDPVPIAQEAGWAPGPFWTGAGNFAPTGFRSQDPQHLASRYTDCATRPVTH